MFTIFVNDHFWTFKLVQLFAYGCFLFGRKFYPRFVASTVVIIVSLRYLYVIVELDNLGRFDSRIFC